MGQILFSPSDGNVDPNRSYEPCETEYELNQAPN